MQVVLAQEVEAGRRVGIVLMLGRLLRLRLDVELAREADLLGVVDGHVQEAGEVLELALHVGVPQILVAFAAAPERVAGAAELLGDFERLLHLRGGEGERLGVAGWWPRRACSGGLLNRLAVPQSSLMPVRCCSSLSTFTTASRLRFVSARFAPSGATSRSWNA